MTPPLWLRHVIPWRVLRFYDRHRPTCWSGIAMWKMGYDGWSWQRQSDCWGGAQGGWDYCGKFETKPDFIDGTARSRS